MSVAIATLDFQPLITGGYITLLAVAAAAVLVYLTVKVPPNVAWLERLGLLALRGLFLASLVLLALNPGLLTIVHPEEDKPAVVWMVDKSKSMGVTDGTRDGKARLRAASETAAPWLAGGSGPLLHKAFLFDSRAQEVPAAQVDAARPDGAATNIPGALTDMFRSFPASQRVSAVFVMSDGVQTVEAEVKGALATASARRAKVYPVVLGGKVAVKDLAVSISEGRKVSFVGHPISISAQVTWESLGPRRVSVRLVQSGRAGRPDQVLDTRPLDLSGTGKQTVTFSVKNDEAGFYRYAIVTDPLGEEFNKQNNRDQTDVITLKEKIRILLVEGNPYWETKYLVQFLQKDESVDIKSIFMLTRGKAFEIGKVDSATAADTESLRFPETIEELQKYNVVILGQDVRFLIEPRHAALLESYLYDHGGALLFARGKPSAGEFPQLARLEPLVWGNPLAAQSESSGGHEMRPTDLGVQLLLFQNRPQQPLAEAMRVLPAVSPRHRVERLKSFAEVLAYAVSGAEEIPAVVVRKMGKGVVATVNAEGLWRWDFLPPRLKEYQGFYPMFWGQLIRWMALRSDFLPGQDISFRSSGLVFKPGQPVQFTVTRRFQAGPPPQLAIRIYEGAEVVQTLIPTPSRANAHVWHAPCFLETPEAVEARHYEARLFDGETAFDQMTIALTVKPRAGETTELSADPEYLDSLARQTGARLLRPDEINGVIAELEKDYVPSARERKEWRLAWDSAWFLLLAAACVAGEWTWRRRKGLL